MRRAAPKRVIVHSLADARAALAVASELRRPIVLASAQGAGGYAGPLWFKGVVEAAAAEFPEASLSSVLDCADEAGTVLLSLRHGIKRVRFTGSAAARKRLQAIAAKLGAEIETGRPKPALDLRDARDPGAALRAYLVPAVRRPRRK